MNKGIVGVDIGGTNTVVGLFTHDLKLVEKRSFTTKTPLQTQGNFIESPVYIEVNTFMDRLCSEIMQLFRSHRIKPSEAVVGVGVPGRVNSELGIACSASNLGWKDVPLAAELNKRLRTTVRIENDVRMYMLGEIMNGAGRDCHSAIGVIIGTGVAAAVYLHGRLVQGYHWYAGEIGHDPVANHDLPCRCGRSGCMETIVSAQGLERMGKMDALSLYTSCLSGNQEACHLFRVLAETLGQKLLTCSLLIDPEVIIIGGGVAAAGHLILDPLREIFSRHYRKGVAPDIRAGILGDDAGIFGAARWAVV